MNCDIILIKVKRKKLPMFILFRFPDLIFLIVNVKTVYYQYICMCTIIVIQNIKLLSIYTFCSPFSLVKC